MDIKAAEDFILQKLSNELSSNLHYHSKNHVLDVLQAALMYANHEGISDYEKNLLKTAVLFHDSGFTVQTKDHEDIGCDIVRKNLPDFGYASEDIERICGMIMATKIPQNPQNHLEAILCDADLDYLGRDDFYSIGATLYEELKAYNVLQNEEAWNRLQVSFLEKHTFFTSTSIERRTLKKVAYLTELRELVESYEKK
jgi:predicted metal-dependent HD superfamily phosphohydrolase